MDDLAYRRGPIGTPNRRRCRDGAVVARLVARGRRAAALGERTSIHNSLKRLADTAAAAIAACPGSGQLVRRSALAPVWMKNRYFQRIVSSVADRSVPATELIKTNGGIASDLRLLLPATKHGMLYGKPGHYLFERATIDLARRLAVRSNAFIDVGANEGLFTFTVAAALGPQRHSAIHAFEPDPVVFDRLAANLHRNNMAVRAHRIAASDHVGTQTFYRNISDDLSGSLTTFFADKHEVAAIETEVTSLARYLEENQIDHACVKIDVEGAGAAVWDGARQARQRIDWLIYEIIGPELSADLPKRIMTDTGWNAYYIRDFDLVRSRAGEFEYREPFYNWLFCAAGPAQLAAALKGSRFRLIDQPVKA
jgi:FkbM family methyltransferase